MSAARALAALATSVLGAVLGAGLPACARQGALAPLPADRPRVGVEFRAEARAGSPGGYVQTPKGGAPGTTTTARPTFDELGVEVGWAPAADLRLAWRRHRLHLGGAFWVLHGEETLTTPLRTYDTAFPAGTRLASETEIGTSWATYGYALDLGRRSGAFTFTPEVGAYGYHLRYQVSGDGVTLPRQFNAFSPLVGSELAWTPGGRIRLTFDSHLVLDEVFDKGSPTTAYEGALRLHFDLGRNGALHLGVGFTHVEHHDSQEVPNDAELDVLPWFSLGGTLRF